MAKAKNYWALEIVNNLTSLTSGHHKRNVFVQDGASSDKAVMFVMLLPGCKVFAIKRSNVEYLLYDIQVSGQYAESQAKGEKPGMYSVKRSDDKTWKASLIKNGEITNKELRAVAIADRYSDVDQAADIVPAFVSGASISGGGVHWTQLGLICTLLQVKRKLEE